MSTVEGTGDALGEAQIDADGLTLAPGGDGTIDAASEQQADERPMPREQRYRLELREAERQRDALVARVEAMQRREVERLAAEHLSEPTDLFEVGGVSLADLLDEAGNIDSAAVAASAAAVIASRPGLAKNPQDRLVDLSQGTGNRGPVSKPISWGDLLR